MYDNTSNLMAKITVPLHMAIFKSQVKGREKEYYDSFIRQLSQSHHDFLTQPYKDRQYMALCHRTQFFNLESLERVDPKDAFKLDYSYDVKFITKKEQMLFCVITTAIQNTVFVCENSKALPLIMDEEHVYDWDKVHVFVGPPLKRYLHTITGAQWFGIGNITHAAIAAQSNPNDLLELKCTPFVHKEPIKSDPLALLLQAMPPMLDFNWQRVSGPSEPHQSAKPQVNKPTPKF